MEYRIKDGLNVCHKGWVIIDEIQHFVNDGFVICNSSLNQRSWNTTELKSTCKICKQKSNIEMSVEQLTLF